MATAINGRTHRAQVFRVDFADEPIVEVDAPTILPPGFETDGLADEGLADEATASQPLNLAIGSHTAVAPTAWVTWRLCSTITPPTPVINLGGRDQTEGFMRTLLVVSMQPALQTPLLGGRGRGRRPVDGWSPL